MKRITIAALIGLAILVTGASAMAVKRTPSDLVRQMVDRARVQPAFNGTVQSVDDYSARLATVIVADVTALQVRIADHIDIGTNDAPKLQPGDKLEVRWWDEEYTAVALKRQTTFLPLVLAGRTQPTPLLAPIWTSGHPRIAGTNIEGAWGVVPGAMRYDVWRNTTTPSPDGAEYYGTFGTNSFTRAIERGLSSVLSEDGGFESGTLSSYLVIQGNASVQTSVKKSGTYAAKLVGVDDGVDNTDARLAGNLWKSNADGVTISFWYRMGSAVTPQGTLRVLILEEDLTALGAGGDDFFITVETETWTQYSFTMPVGFYNANYRLAFYAITAGGAGTEFIVYLDDIQITGAPDGSTADDFFAVRAVDTSGNASPFSTWLQPIAQSALLGTAQFTPDVGLMAAAVADQSASKTFATDGTIVSIPGAVARIAVFSFDGSLVAGAGALRLSNQTGRTVTISEVYCACGTAPTTNAIIVDIHKSGTTIFTNQAHRPQIAAAANAGNTTTIDVASWADGEYLTCDLDQVGVAGGAGSDLTVHVVFA